MAAKIKRNSNQTVNGCNMNSVQVKILNALKLAMMKTSMPTRALLMALLALIYGPVLVRLSSLRRVKLS